MKRTPSWKIKRELRRLGRQLIDIPRNLIWYLFATPYHDHILARRRRTYDGGLPDSDRVAIYVIFPRNGLLESHLLAVRHIALSGYAPLVVANQPLSDADRARLLPECWRLIERQNFGYDFAGYRDGMLSLPLDRLARVALLNDSVWFPLPDSRNWLKEAEETGHDFTGAVSNYGVSRRHGFSPDRLEWKYGSDHPNFHYCSFALSIGPAILRDPGFRRFWSGFRLENRKNKVVRRGEIGLTTWVLRRGFSHDATVDMAGFDKILRGLDDDALYDFVTHLVIPEGPVMVADKRAFAALPRSTPDWRNRGLALAFNVIAQQGGAYVLAAFLTGQMGYPFLKKSPLWLDPDARDITLGIIAALPGPVGETIHREAVVLARK